MSGHNAHGRSAIVLLSGGLDSATVLAMAVAERVACHTVAFDYGQRHRHELRAAAEVADAFGALSHRVIGLDLRAIGGSALTDDIAVPKDRAEDAIAADIPVTYVPARNLVFLSLAAGLAEVVGAQEVHIGVNAVDYSGYPDCRRAFIDAFESAANLATRAGVEGAPIRVVTPLVELTKAEIIRRGVALGVDYGMTHSCYDPGDSGLACGRCDSCALRRRGFAEAGVADPTRYAPR
ncbi:MAG: 7-cyano-7-deazaguanine synthase QueC [Phycisphaerales bacterium]